METIQERFNKIIPQKIQELVLSKEIDNIILAMELCEMSLFYGWYFTCESERNIPYFPSYAIVNDNWDAKAGLNMPLLDVEKTMKQVMVDFKKLLYGT